MFHLTFTVDLTLQLEGPPKTIHFNKTAKLPSEICMGNSILAYFRGNVTSQKMFIICLIKFF